ncbi:DUF2335 domain-containing protein [Vreelandella aquamarina]|uniref:DUF2335 domain-containing protein n=1 Tax=Vreelandella aquamarina TaxID=77097 RepID=UPI00385032B2
MEESSNSPSTESGQDLKRPNIGLRAFEARSLTYSGPLPPSSEMERYETITPGAADRILAMAEQQQRHRHNQESKENEANARIADSNIRIQDASIKEVRRGQWMGFVLGLAFLGVTTLLGLNGHEIAASVLGLGGVAAVATVFIKVRSKQ